MAGVKQAAAGAIVGLGVLVTTALAASPTAVAGEEVPTGGPVTGKIIAAKVHSKVLGLCASECVTRTTVSDDVEGNHLLDVSQGEIRSQEDAIPAGSYRVAFNGSPYGHGTISRGYLRRTVAGRYQVVKKFADATEFTVVEGEELDLGTLNTRTGRAWLGETWYYGFGGEMTGVHMKIRAVDFPKGGKLVLRSVGCGGKVYKKTYRKSGDFKAIYDDSGAYRHYGKDSHLFQLIVRREGDRDQVWKAYAGWSNWKCP